MNEPNFPSSKEPPTSSIPATPAGQRVQSWGNRAWRAFGTTPWWRLVVGGLIVIVATALIALPFDSLLMANQIRSQAAKDALRTSIQHVVLERARGGLVIARSIASSQGQVEEIDSAIADIDREVSKPLARDRFVGSLGEIETKMATHRAKRDALLRSLQDAARDMTLGNSGAADKIREITEEVESMTDALKELEEQRDEMIEQQRERERELQQQQGDDGHHTQPSPPQPSKPAASPKLPKSPAAPAQPAPAQPAPAEPPTPPAPPAAPKSVVMSQTSDATQKVVHVRVNTVISKMSHQDNAAVFNDQPTSIGFLPGEPDANTIRSTIQRDTKKFIFAAFATIGALLFFVLMLIARAFAGRATRGEQRAVIAESRERSESHARQLAEARLTLMRAQVEPHFLFNTLAHVQALQEIDPPQASTMLERLISYLRAAMPSMRETKSTLGREIEVVRAYLDLLKIRMGERLRYSIDVPSELNHISLPPTMIATLVENAIKHGLEPKKEGGNIAVNVRELDADERYPKRLEILVADDGLGFGGANTSGTGVGIANTRERLKMLYGRQGELAVESNAPNGVRAIIRVPLEASESMMDHSDDTFAAEYEREVSPFTVKFVACLAALLGWLGVHRFYVGHMRSGALFAALALLSILSDGVAVFVVPLVIGVALDMVRIITLEFRDAQQRRIVHWRAQDRGQAVPSFTDSNSNVSPYKLNIVALLALFGGFSGIHRFYVGRFRTGAIQAVLLALCILSHSSPVFLVPLAVWVVLDLAWVVSRNFRDVQGRLIMRSDRQDVTNYSASREERLRDDATVSPCSRGIALLLAVLLGWLGAHRFYAGRVGSGLGMLLTLGGLGVWWLVDIVTVATGQLKDMDGKWVREWE